MRRTAVALIVAGIIFYVTSILLLHVNNDPLPGIRSADLVVGFLIGGTFVALAGLTLWHRQSLQQQRHS